MDMERKLTQIFANVNDWLRFSEAKNGILIAFISATIWAAIKTIIEFDNAVIEGYCYSYVAFAGVGIVILLFSLLPQTKLQRFWKTQKPLKEDNLLFFGHLQKYDEKGLLGALEERYDLKSKNKNFEFDMANQIIQNAKIATRKYGYFKAAFWFVVTGVLPPLGFILFIILDPNE